jgi:hypothetical protein
MHHHPVFVGNEGLVPFGESVHVQLTKAGKKQLIEFGKDFKAQLLHEQSGLGRLAIQDTIFFLS